MTDTIETLKAAAADLTARVAAFEEAQKRVEEEEPPALTQEQDDALRRCWNPTAVAAVDRLRYCERELARLWEGLKRAPDDLSAHSVQWYAVNRAFGINDSDNRVVNRGFSELARHRALLKPGGGK